MRNSRRIPRTLRLLGAGILLLAGLGGASAHATTANKLIYTPEDPTYGRRCETVGDVAAYVPPRDTSPPRGARPSSAGLFVCTKAGSVQTARWVRVGISGEGASDEQVLTYESSGTTFEWDTNGAGGGDTVTLNGSSMADVNLVDDPADGIFYTHDAVPAPDDLTISVDLTELDTVNIGTGSSFPDIVFNSFGPSTMTLEAAPPLLTLTSSVTDPAFVIDDQGTLRLREEDASGNNYLAIRAPSSVTSNQTCTFEDDASFIPDSCVGDGSDGGDDLSTLDAVTFGTGTGVPVFTFDGLLNDPAFTVLSSGILVTEGGGATPFFGVDDRGPLRLYEDDANGGSFLGWQAPAAVTSSQTCVLEDDASFIPDSCVGDGSDDDTPAVYVATVADGTGIDGTASGTGSTYTPTLDLTELNTLTFGDATSIPTLNFDVVFGGDVSLAGSSNGFYIAAGGTSPHLALDDQGSLRFYEEDGSGSNNLAIQPPSAITSDQTCTLENDASFIPDSCVGNGSDADTLALFSCNDGERLTWNGGVFDCVVDGIERVSSDVTDSTAGSTQNITGLTQAVGNGETWAWSCEIYTTSAALTTAVLLSVNGPSTSALQFCMTTATFTTSIVQECAAAFDTMSTQTSSAAGAMTPNRITGTATFSAGGTLAMRMDTEVGASTVTVEAGSFCRFTQVL